MIVVTLACAGVALGQSAASAYPVTMQQSGSPGRYLAQRSVFACSSAGYSGGHVWVAGADISESPAYANSFQWVSERVQIQYWNGAGWKDYGYGPWHSHSITGGPGYTNQSTTSFDAYTLDVPALRGYYVRFAQEFQFALGGPWTGPTTVVGFAKDYYTVDSYAAAGSLDLRPGGACLVGHS